MPVTVVCDKCGRQLRIADEQVGKRAKCPQCKEVILLQPAGEKVAASPKGGGATATKTAPAGGSGKGTKGKSDWFVLTADQQEFGPIPKSELDTWISEGRLDSQCQVLQEGWEQWKWADEVFPALAASAAPANKLPGPTAPMSITPAPTQPGPSISTPSFPGQMPGMMPSAGPMDVNPYSSPGVATMSAATGEVPQGVLMPLRNTQGWILVFVILGGIWLLFASLGLLGALAIMLMAGSPGGALVVVLFLGAPMAVAGFFTFLLYRYYDAIGVCSRQPSFQNLQRAIEAQQNYWMTLAIGVLIMIGLQMLLSFAVSVFGGALLGILFGAG